MTEKYRVKITHKEYGFFSVYEIEAKRHEDAEREAKQQFKKSFCNSDTPLSDLEAFTSDKHQVDYRNQLNSLI